MADYAGLPFPPSWSMLRASSMGSRPPAAVTLAASLSLFPNSLAALHAVNVAIHFLVGLALFGLVRRMVFLLALGLKANRQATLLAFLSAALWAVLPLQTQVVT